MDLEARGGIAVLRLRGTKGNSITPDVIGELDALVRDVARSDARALVVTGEGKFFSAGLALPALVARSRDEMRAFMGEFSAAMRQLFQLPKPVVAAINGHAIAGGAVLALQCDVRLAAAGEYKIGLNESQLGISLPTAVMEPLRLAVPARSLGAIALEGRLFSPAEALGLGLVDALVPAAELEARAVAHAEALGAIPALAFATTKAALRRPVLEAIGRYAEADAERWLDTWFSATAQERLRAAVKSLGG
jgi:enoyl-CoA hydratase